MLFALVLSSLTTPLSRTQCTLCVRRLYSQITRVGCPNTPCLAQEIALEIERARVSKYNTLRGAIVRGSHHQPSSDSGETDVAKEAESELENNERLGRVAKEAESESENNERLENKWSCTAVVARHRAQVRPLGMRRALSL